MKIQLDIPEELNKELKKYRIDNNIKNMQEALIIILYDKFVDKIKHKRRKK